MARKSSKEVTRARATPEVTQQRIELIADMMRALEWERGKSAVPLAKEWQLAVVTVEGMAVEASRIVRRESAPKRGQTQADIGANLVHLSNRLTEAVDELCDAKDYATAAKAAQAATQAGNVATMILGERAAEKQEHTHDISGPGPDDRDLILSVLAAHDSAEQPS